MKQIVIEGKAPWGSLYHFFPEGKEQLGIAAVKRYGERYNSLIAHKFRQALGPLEALNDLFASTTKDLLDSEFSDGCPIMAIALDAMNASESIRQACAEVIDGWVRALAFGLVDYGMDEISATDTATFIIGALEGAITLSRITRSTLPLAKAADMSAMIVLIVLNGIKNEKSDPNKPLFEAPLESDLIQGAN